MDQQDDQLQTPSSTVPESDHQLEFQLLLRQRRINELLNSIEDLRSQIEPSHHVPFSIDLLIQSMNREIKSNDDEIHLLQQIVSSTGIPESERAVQERLRNVIEQNRALGRELGVENLERLHAERALLKREQELLKETEDDMKQNIQDLMKQKREANMIIKKYIEKHGAIEPASQTTP